MSLFFMVAAWPAVGCHDRAIGRPCNLLADAGANQPTLNYQATECPERICSNPAATVSASVNTQPLCTAECTKDSDCEDGQIRNKNDKNDFRCVAGWVCGVVTVTGSGCCKKLCICEDFVNVPEGGLQLPPECQKNVTNTCKNIK
jgi:hypothetical protein